MKKLLLVFLIGLFSIGMFAQIGLYETPDTVANLGSRKDLRDNSNWSVRRNVIDRDSIDILNDLITAMDIAKEDQLVNKAGLYSALSDVTQFVEAANNLSDLDDDSAAVSNLGLGWIYYNTITLYGGDYFVATWGDDGNDGSFDAPWLTLAYACQQVSTPGDTIHVSAGEYTETLQCELAAGVSIIGEGDGTHIISTYYLNEDILSAAIILYSASEGTAGNQSISHIKLDGSSETSMCGITARYRSNVKIHDCTIVDFTGAGIYFMGGGENGTLYAPGTLPTTYETGNEVYNCTITNCADNDHYGGLITIEGQEGPLIHDNVLTQISRADGYNGRILKAWGGHVKGVKYYNNVSTKPPVDEVDWNMHLEFGTVRGGIEIYNNEFYEGQQLDLGGYDNIKTTYDYTMWVHDNLFTSDSIISSSDSPHDYYSAISIECISSDVLINNNHIANKPFGVLIDVDQANKTIDNIRFSNNIFENIGFDDSGWSVFCLIKTSYVTDTIRNIYWYDNMIKSGNADIAFYINPIEGVIHDIYIRNNTIQDFTGVGWLAFADGNGPLSNIYSQSNVLYNNTYNNEIYHYNAKAVTNLVDQYVSKKFNFAEDAQGNDDYEIDLPITNLTVGLVVVFTANTANTGGATLEITNVGDLDAILKMNDQALVTGDIEAGQVVVCFWDGSNYQMISQVAQ